MSGNGAQPDVVRLRAGEVEERGAVALLRHGADVDLQARAQHDRRTGRAVGENIGDVFVAHQLIADRRAVLRRHHNVQISDRVAAPAITAGHDDATAVAEKAHQRFRFGFGDRQLEAFLGGRLFERGRKFLFNDRAESAQPVQPSRFDDATKIVEGAHLELVVNELDAFRPQAGESGNLAKLAGQLPFQRVEQGEMSGLDDFRDLAGQVLADTGKLRQVASG